MDLLRKDGHVVTGLKLCSMEKSRRNWPYLAGRKVGKIESFEELSDNGAMAIWEN